MARVLLAGGPGAYGRRCFRGAEDQLRRRPRVRARGSGAAALARRRRRPAAAGGPAPPRAPAGAPAPARPDRGPGPRGVRDRGGALPPAAPAGAAAAADGHVVRRGVAGRALPAVERGADPAPAGRAGALPRSRPRRRPAERRPDRARRPALRERARRRPGALARDRPQADVGRPALRARPDAVEPVRGVRRRRASRCTAPLPHAGGRGRTRRGPCARLGRRTHDHQRALGDRGRPACRPGLDDEEREWITRCIAITKAVQD